MSDLDDFFAKKSRKKKTKNASAILAGDLLNQKKEQEVRKQKKLKDKDDKSSEPLSAFLKKTMEDEEWNDVETEKEPTAADLSRIQNLTISRETEQTRDGEDRNNAGAESEDHQREEGDKGGAAWGASGADQPNGTESDNESGSGGEPDEPSKEAPIPTPSAKESRTASDAPSADAEGAKSGGGGGGGGGSAPKAYVAPHLRNRPAAGADFSLGGGGSSEFSRSKFQKKAKAPDIGNVEEFPTLGGNSRGESGAWGAEAAAGRGFTKVQHGGASGGNTRSGYTRHGGLRSDGGKRAGESLTLENRYATLSDDC